MIETWLGTMVREVSFWPSSENILCSRRKLTDLSAVDVYYIYI